MTSRSQLGGVSRVTSLPCGFSGNVGVSAQIFGPKIAVTSGNTGSAGTLNTLLNASGSKFRLNALTVTTNDATPRDVRVKITIDGASAFDFTVSIAAIEQRVAVGSVVSGTTQSIIFQPVDALRSLKIEYSSSVGSETGKLSFAYNYEIRQ